MRGWGKKVCRSLDPRFGLWVPLGSEGVGVGLPAGLGASVRVRACARPGEPAAPRPVAVLSGWVCEQCTIGAERTARPGGRQPRLSEPLRCGWLLPDLLAAAAKARAIVGRRRSRGAKTQALAAASRAWNSVQVEQVRPRTRCNQGWE